MPGAPSESVFLRHISCPDCGSRDNNSEWSDGHEYCYGCGRYRAGEGAEDGARPTRKNVPLDLIRDVEIRGLRQRKITDETCKHFGYGYAEHKGKPVQVAPYYNSDRQLVAQKIRGKGKEFKALGDISDALPFGAHLWPPTGKKIVVTEGEIDAMSMSQVQGNKWPVVSIGCGAGAQTKKYIARHLDFFRGYEEVILMFDMDEPGRKASIAAAEVLGSRAKIAELPLKDANEMLVAGRTEELVNAMWKAKPYRPDGIVDLASLEEEVMRPVEIGMPWWSDTLTRLTFGRRSGETYALGAGTGVGKTDFFTQQIAYDVEKLGLSVGVFALEQGPAETAKRIAGKLAGHTFHIPDAGWTQDDLRAAWARLMETGKVYLYDSFGMNEWDAIRDKIEYLATAFDVKVVYLDHLTALAAGEDNEREALEFIMADMASLAKRLGIIIVFISHLATPEGKPHEEGGRVTIRHFKGSRAIGFWSHYMFGLERDQQAEDPHTRQTTTFRVLKDRYTGRATGEVFYLAYDRATGLLYETSAPDAGASHGFVDETQDAEGVASDF